VTSALGPLPSSDPRFMRRVRVHQAWYRLEVLGLENYGRLAVSGRPCGSVLPDDAAASHMNFLTEEAVSRYTERRTQGWGVDPERCMKYLTSSQTLSFNMLAQAVQRPAECALLFNRLLGRTDLAWLEHSMFEFASQGSSYSLGDKTLLDLLLRFQTTNGSLQVIAVETKLADRFSTRRTSGMRGPRYLELGHRRGVWADINESLEDNQTRQLTRCHALAESVQERDSAGTGHAVMVVLTHPHDTAGDACVSKYAGGVARSDAVMHHDWTSYLSAATSVGAIEDSASSELRRRYVDLAWSDEAWQDLERSSFGVAARRGD
jgi:hypothetical protein